MTRFARPALVVCIALLFVNASALAQGGRRRGGDNAGPPPWNGPASVEGKVVDEAGKPVSDAKVTLVCVAVNSGFNTLSNRKGEFSGRGMKTGEWRLQVEAANFPTSRQTVQVADGKNPVVNVQLRRDTSPELLASAEGLFKAGKYADARAEYMKVLEAHPDLTGINRAIAFTYGREGNHAEALKYLDLALANNPNDTQLLQLAAASAINVNDFPRAMGYLAKIDEATIADPDPLQMAAVNLINKHRSAEAIALLDRVAARFPQAPDAYFYRGFAKLQADKNADGRADLEKFVAMAPAESPLLAQAKDLLTKLK